jgi:hypothetical protein
MKNSLNRLTPIGRWPGLVWRRTFGAGFRCNRSSKAPLARCYPGRRHRPGPFWVAMRRLSPLFHEDGQIFVFPAPLRDLGERWVGRL